MTPLRWTRTPPTEAGWYFVRTIFKPGYDDVEPITGFFANEVVAVFPEDGTLQRLGRGDPYTIPPSDMENAWMEWAGPIAPPEEPRSGDPEAAEEEEA